MNTNNQAGTIEPVSKHRLISKVLSPAVRLWLRAQMGKPPSAASQVDFVANLEVKISGSDRQILTGYLPRVSVSANHAVYQGLHLSQIQLVGENIRPNLGQVLRGQPLRILEPVPVFGELLLKESDLNASLQSPLLANALTDLLRTLLPAYSVHRHRWHQITINNGQLIISATLAVDTSKPMPVTICTGLQLASCHELVLQPQIQTQVGASLVNLDSFKLDLGPEVAIEELTLSSGQMLCRGCINVIP